MLQRVNYSERKPPKSGIYLIDDKFESMVKANYSYKDSMFEIYRTDYDELVNYWYEEVEYNQFETEEFIEWLVWNYSKTPNDFNKITKLKDYYEQFKESKNGN